MHFPRLFSLLALAPLVLLAGCNEAETPALNEDIGYEANRPVYDDDGTDVITESPAAIDHDHTEDLNTEADSATTYDPDLASPVEIRQGDDTPSAAETPTAQPPAASTSPESARDPQSADTSDSDVVEEPAQKVPEELQEDPKEDSGNS